MTLRLRDLRLSDKGRYVEGLVELFGGLSAASRFFGNSFWRNVVEHICNRSVQADSAALEPVQNRLRKQRAQLALQIEEGNFEQLGQYVLSIARSERTRDVDLSWDKLVQRFMAQRRVYLQLNPGYLQDVPDSERETQPSGFSREEDEAIDGLRQALQAYVESGVFFQGVRYRCGVCGLAFWQSVTEARQSVECEGCRTSVALRVEQGWTYRLNTLVRNAVTYHGAIPVIWTLSMLRRRSMLLYSPGVALYRAWDDSVAAAELDIVSVQDGKLLIAEVKTSPSEFTDDQLKTLGDLGMQFAVDVVMVSAFRGDQKQIEAVAQRLERQWPNRSFTVVAIAPYDDIDEPTPDARWFTRWSL